MNGYDFDTLAKKVRLDVLIGAFHSGDEFLKRILFAYFLRRDWSGTSVASLYTETIKDRSQPISLRKVAVRGYVRCASDPAPLLREIMHGDERELRSTVLDSLPSQDPTLDEDVIVALLQMGFRDADDGVRYTAVSACHSFWVDYERRLQFPKKNDEFVDALSFAMQSFSRLDDGNVQSRLIDQLKHPDPEIRSWTAEALGEGIRSPISVDNLRKINDALQEPNEKVRQNLCCLLTAQEADPVRKHVPRLIDCLNDKDSNVQFCAAVAVGTLKMSELTDKLIDMLFRKYDNYFNAGLTGLSWMGDRSPKVIAAINAAVDRKFVDRQDADEAIACLKSGGLTRNAR